MRNKRLLYKVIETLRFICYNSFILPNITTNGSILPQGNLKNIPPLFLILEILDQVTASKKFTQIYDYQSTKRPTVFLLGTEWFTCIKKGGTVTTVSAMLVRTTVFPRK